MEEFFSFYIDHFLPRGDRMTSLLCVLEINRRHNEVALQKTELAYYRLMYGSSLHCWFRDLIFASITSFIFHVICFSFNNQSYVVKFLFSSLLLLFK